MLKAVVTSDSYAEAIVESMSPEIDRELSRTRAEVSLDSGIATIRIEASDTSAMRAALNSYLECMTVVQKVEQIAKVRQ